MGLGEPDARSAEGEQAVQRRCRRAQRGRPEQEGLLVGPLVLVEQSVDAEQLKGCSHNYQFAGKR